MLEVDSPDGGRGQLPFDGISDLVSMLGAVLEAELGERAACAGWFNDATNRAGCDDAGIPRGEEPRLAVFLHIDGLHIHGHGHAHAWVARPIVRFLTAGDTGMDKKGVAVEDVGERRGVRMTVFIDGGDDAVFAHTEDVASFMFVNGALGELFHGMVHVIPFDMRNKEAPHDEHVTLACRIKDVSGLRADRRKAALLHDAV